MHRSIALSYRISPTTVGRIIRETCEALWSALQAKGFLKVPNEQNTWKEISHRFEEMWNFLHCIGAIDGKHVVMLAPANSGSEWFNYKKTHSIVLLAICTADYEFTLVDIGDAGRQSDGGVYSNSKLGYAIDNNIIDIPPPEPIPTYNASISFPYIFVADDAFQIKPFVKTNLSPEKLVCNYRISRSRRTIENTFGIAAA